ncbi:MAG TPA: SoxR reducing system RseC family protein [Rhodocyclaceae bacterium]|nr:SoxR reducing system RseC family protein [Rhodocyclaceae bacterium]
MIEARGVVVRVEQGRAWVKVSDRQEGCGRCDEPGGCRSVKLAYAVKGPNDTFSVPDGIGVRVGEQVVVRMDDGAPLRGALASYGVGAALLLVGAALGHMLAGEGSQDLFAVVGGAIGLGAAFALNRLLYRSRRWRQMLHMDLARDEGDCTLHAGKS